MNDLTDPSERFAYYESLHMEYLRRAEQMFQRKESCSAEEMLRESEKILHLKRYWEQRIDEKA